MKKFISVCLTVVIVGSLMIGYSAVKDVFQKANGLILYGDEQQIKDSFEHEKKTLKEKDEYKIKVVEEGNQKIVILDEKTTRALVEKELLKEVKNDDDTELITSLPAVTDGKGILFAKQQMEEINLEDQPIKVTYGGNKIIGDARAYGDMFLIVADTDWSAIKGTEKTMGIIKYDKDPSEKMGDFDVEYNQLVKIGE